MPPAAWHFISTRGLDLIRAPADESGGNLVCSSLCLPGARQTQATSTKLVVSPNTLYARPRRRRHCQNSDATHQPRDSPVSVRPILGWPSPCEMVALVSWPTLLVSAAASATCHRVTVLVRACLLHLNCTGFFSYRCGWEIKIIIIWKYYSSRVIIKYYS